MESYADEVAEIATAIGLEVGVRKRIGYHTMAAAGELDGQAVRIDAVFQGYREQSWVLMESSIQPPLDLSLHVKRTMLSLGTGVSIDYPGFTDEHHVSAEEPGRARQLLTPEVCKKITAIADLGGDIDLDDRRASVRQTMGFTEIRPTLHALTRITSAIAERFVTLPPAPPLVEAAEVWRAYAEREGLRFETSPLALVGAQASAITRRVGPGSYVTDITVRLEEPLEMGIAIRPARRMELLWEIFAGSDVQVGDAPFDRAFTVAARDPASAAVVLDASVRAEIMALRKAGDVHLGDHGISLCTTHFEEVPGAIDRMRSILEAVWQNARTVGRRGPYR